MKQRILKLCIFCMTLAGIAWFAWLRPVAVETCLPERTRLAEGVFGTGTLEAKNRVAISPHDTSEIIALHADQGDEIRKGQLLVEMFSDDIVQQQRIAEAELAVTHETIKRLEAELVSDQAKIDYAESDFQRHERLFKMEFKPQSQYEKALETRKVVKAAYEQTSISKKEAELTAVRQTAQIEYWKTKLSETKLLAPFDGYVVRRNRELGAVVNPGASILDIIDKNDIWASVWVDETRIGRIVPGLKATVEARAMPGIKLSGTVRRTSRETDRETREHLVDIALERLPDNWSVGQRLEATIEIGPAEDRLCVPAAAICWDNGESVILVIRDGRIRLQEVKLGISAGPQTEILSGLAPDDIVILKPMAHLKHVGRKTKSTSP